MPENLQIIVCQPVSTFADNGDHVAERKIVLWLSFELENIKMPNGFRGTINSWLEMNLCIQSLIFIDFPSTFDI